MQTSVRPSLSVPARPRAVFVFSFRRGPAFSWLCGILASICALALFLTRPAQHLAAPPRSAHSCAHLHDYEGHPAAIKAWQARRPQKATTLEEITNPFLHEIVFRLRTNARFQEILVQLEHDRRQRFHRKRLGSFTTDPRGTYVRETAVMIWMPAHPGALGVYEQRHGGVFSYSNYARTGSGDGLTTRCDVVLTGEAVFQIRIHTHPWGTVPSSQDLSAAQLGIVDFVISEKDGEPTVYVFSERGTSWEIPTRLFEAERPAVTMVANSTS